MKNTPSAHPVCMAEVVVSTGIGSLVLHHTRAMARVCARTT
jgi:hypothetical protein